MYLRLSSSRFSAATEMHRSPDEVRLAAELTGHNIHFQSLCPFPLKIGFRSFLKLQNKILPLGQSTPDDDSVGIECAGQIEDPSGQSVQEAVHMLYGKGFTCIRSSEHFTTLHVLPLLLTVSSRHMHGTPQGAHAFIPLQEHITELPPKEISPLM